jgi:hypothetical protein
MNDFIYGFALGFCSAVGLGYLSLLMAGCAL